MLQDISENMEAVEKVDSSIYESIISNYSEKMAML